MADTDNKNTDGAAEQAKPEEAKPEEVKAAASDDDEVVDADPMQDFPIVMSNPDEGGK